MKYYKFGTELFHLYSGNFDLDFTCTKKTWFINPGGVALYIFGPGMVAGPVSHAVSAAGGSLTKQSQTCEYKIYMNLMTVDVPRSHCSVIGGTRKPIVLTNDGNEELCL